MPEGPEIKRSADQIARAIMGQPLQDLSFVWPALQPWESEMRQQEVVSVQARSKAMLITFSNQLTLYSHNQLYGVWYVRQNDAGLPTGNRQLRLMLEGPAQRALLYSATEIALLDPDQLQAHPYLLRLGPDVLDEAVQLEQVHARYQDSRFMGRRLNALLLDQGFLAGLGNYLRSEILFLAGIPPHYRPKDCSEQQLEILATASLLLPRRSYQTQGCTNLPERVKALKAQGLSRKAYRFYVFDRQDEPCYLCGTAIEKIMAGTRRLYFCPRCQSESTTDSPFSKEES